MKHRTRTAALLLAGVLLSGLPATSADAPAKTPVLLELFTSEGCSSCPPADRLLQSLDQTQPIPDIELVVLSEHVDYWNGPGWHDPYSSHRFTERQLAYAELLHVAEVYTPEMVVDGQREAIGGNPAAIRKAIEAVRQTPKIPLTLSSAVRNGNRLKFHVSSGELATTSAKATLYLVIAQEKAQSSVAGGENGGRVLTHVAVARSLRPLAKLAPGESCSKDATVSLPFPAATPLRLIAFLEDDQSHRVLAVSQLRL